MLNTKDTHKILLSAPLNMMVSCVRPCMDTSYEGGDWLQVQTIRAKRNQCKENLLLENINHEATYVVGKRDKGNA